MLEDAKKIKMSINKIRMKQKGIKTNEINQKSTLYSIKTLYKARNSVIKCFDVYFSFISEVKYKSIQVKGGNTFGNLLNEIPQVICSLYLANKITNKVYNNIINSAKVWYKMYTIFMNSDFKTITQTLR